MKVLAIYYVDRVEGRQKFVITNPSEEDVAHYLWVSQHIRNVPEGHSVGVFNARMEIPIRTQKRDVWLLDRDGIRTIRLEEIDTPGTFWSEAA